MKKMNAQDAFGKAGMSLKALLDDKALLTGVVYADLNPVRAGDCG